MTFLNKDLQFKERLDEFFPGNSRIISDCRVCSILKTIPGCRVSRRDVLVLILVLKMSLSSFTNFVFPLLEWLPVLVITEVLVRMRKIHVKKDPWKPYSAGQ